MDRLGIALVGQSPQPDYNDMIERWVRGVSVVQRGALDGIPEDDIINSVKDGGMRLAVRLADGRPVEVSHALVAASLPRVIRSLVDSGCRVTLVACTGDFDGGALSEAAGPGAIVLLPSEVLLAIASAMWRGRRLAVCIPLASQKEWARRRWTERGVDPVVVHQPICVGRESMIEAIAGALGAGAGGTVDGIVMDCMGYRDEEVAAVREATGLPVLSARGAAGCVLKALL